MEARGAFDLRDGAFAIRECAACGEPMGARLDHEPVRATCGYCNAEAMLLALPTSPGEGPAHAYRERGVAAPRARGLIVDLTERPRGYAGTMEPKAIREAWLLAKKEATPDEEGARSERDHLLVWLAATCSMQFLRKRDALRARAVLESALELITTPAYRAMVFARLSRLASTGGAPPLGRAWLDRAPRGLRLAEVETDLDIAEAFVARAEAKPAASLEALGGPSPSRGDFVGPLRELAVAVRVDAHEALGNKRAAVREWMEGGRGGRVRLQQFAVTYGLAEGTRRRVLWRGLWALTMVFVLLTIVTWMLRAFAAREVAPWYVWAALGFVLVNALVLRYTRR